MSKFSKISQDENDITKENEDIESHFKGKNREDKESNQFSDEKECLKKDKKQINFTLFDTENNKNNEMYYFLLLSVFIIMIYRLVKVHKEPIRIGILQDGVWKDVNDPEVIKHFDSRFNDILPKITLDDKKGYPKLKEVLNSRVLYVYDRNITSRYIRQVRQIEGQDESLYEQELFKDLKPNDTFSEEREGFIKTDKFIELCREEKLIDEKKFNATETPTISIIIPSHNQKSKLMRSIRSIQNQSLKNIEIIIVDDLSTDDSKDVYKYLLESDPRIRVFYHLDNMGLFRSRLNGFLYSRGKYVLHFNAGDLLADNYVLEDLNNLVIKYSLDSVRFKFKTYKKSEDGGTYRIKTIHYSKKERIIKYGPVKENVHVYGFGTIWNRLVRSNVFTKGLDVLDWFVLNAYKNLWEDTWWNRLSNPVSLSYLINDRIGYIHFSSKEENALKISTKEERDKTIREFIYFWLFDYQLLPLDNDKKVIIKKLRMYNMKNGTYFGTPLNLNYLTSNFTGYERLLKILIKDPCVKDIERPFLNDLLNNYTNYTSKLSKY